MLHLFENNLKLFFPEFFLVSSILLLILHGSFFSVSKESKYPLIHISTNSITVFILIITWLLLFFYKDSTKVLFNGTFICDSLSQNSKLIIVGATAICLLICLSYVKDSKINSFEYYLLILLAVFGSLLLCSSYDLISLYLAIELQSLCLYVLATFNRNSAYSTEAGLKYFILGAFSSGLLLFGISVIYMFTGTTNFEDLHLLLSLDNDKIWSIQIGLLFLSCAFLFKISGAPFHIWSPDIYDGAPLSSTVFFAVVPKLGILVLFLRVFFFCFGVHFFYCQYIFLVSALCSIILGSFLALKQQKIKRLLAYSSIGHVGYTLLAFNSGSLEGFHASLFYLVVYMLTNIGIWCVIISLKSVNSIDKTRTLMDLSFLSKTNSLLGFCMMIFIFSIAGVPPLIGFYAKFYVFFSALNVSFYVSCFCIILVNVVSTFYYLRLIKTIFFEKTEINFEMRPISKEISLVLGCSWFLIVFLFINPNILWLFTQETILSAFI